jgi:hypothetical protein
VKRAAVAEVQKAMALAEKRALESVAGERIKMERILMEANNNRKFNPEDISGATNNQVSQASKDQVSYKLHLKRNLKLENYSFPQKT